VAWVVRTVLNLNISRWRRRRREAMGGIERFDRRRGWWAARRRDFDTALR
jgi:post-segregation antitoxin (ccd killing protein)